MVNVQECDVAGEPNPRRHDHEISPIPVRHAGHETCSLSHRGKLDAADPQPLHPPTRLPQGLGKKKTRSDTTRRTKVLPMAVVLAVPSYRSVSSLVRREPNARSRSAGGKNKPPRFSLIFLL